MDGIPKELLERLKATAGGPLPPSSPDQQARMMHNALASVVELYGAILAPLVHRNELLAQRCLQLEERIKALEAAHSPIPKPIVPPVQG
jgi:hypothetical protein